MSGGGAPAAGAPSATGPYVRVVLVGFMGAGKSRVARETARLMGWRAADVDQEVERRAGRGIPQIFRQEGEAAFRLLEGAVTAELLLQKGIVLATGGGWASASPGRMEALGGDTLSVWLRIPAEEAVRRVAVGRGRQRPLLQVADPLAEARRLLELREPCYRQARLTLDADQASPRALARRIRDELSASPPG